jgi:chromosomal replication initiation ATPase DnaA
MAESPKKTMEHGSYKRFLKSLERFQMEKDHSYRDFKCLENNTSSYYTQNFMGYSKTSKPQPPFTVQQHATNSSNDILKYLKWQQEHEMPLESFDKIKVYRPYKNIPTKVTKEKVVIDMEVNSLEDILKIIETYPYCPSKKYNIDLEALHKIKGEITQIQTMIGLDSVKQSIFIQLLYFLQGFAQDSKNGEYKHTIITGPPGTGKTELAKLIGNMYAKIGILKNNVFKKATRADLVAGYLGQTAIKTKKIIDECIGGVLFIDEAYSLHTEDIFSKECIDTLCESLSDHKKDLMVILAGYKKDLNDSVFTINSGMKSRFLWSFDIDGYTPKELRDIFRYIVTQNEWTLDDDKLKETWFHDKKDMFQGNGRSMEQLFFFSKISHSKRIYGKDSSLKKKLILEDIQNGFKVYKENLNSTKENMLFGLYI